MKRIFNHNTNVIYTSFHSGDSSMTFQYPLGLTHLKIQDIAFSGNFRSDSLKEYYINVPTVSALRKFHFLQSFLTCSHQFQGKHPWLFLLLCFLTNFPTANQ